MDYAQIIDVMKTADMIVRTLAQTKKDEQVLIVGDNDADFVVLTALAAAARAVGAEPTITTMPPRQWAGQGPTRIVAKAIEGADVIFGAGSTTLAHNRPLQDALARKQARFISMVVNSDMMTHGGALADYEELGRVNKRILAKTTGCKKMRITTPAGTDLTGDLGGMPSVEAHGFATNPGDLGCFPDGEVAQGPRDGTAEGIAVIDGSMHMIGVIREPIRLRVKKGRVVAIEGGFEAAKLRRIIEGVPNADNLAEMAIGTNPKARLVGIMAEDKKISGSCHIALGDNIFYGGKTECKLHLDAVMLRTTVEIDGEIIIKDGNILV